MQKIMIRNYIITALRNITGKKVYSFINVGGLAIGMACSILILMWVDHEFSYDRFHSDHKNIQRIGFRAEMLGTSMDVPVAMAPLAGVLRETFPEVDDAVRIDVPENVNVTVNNEHYSESLFLRADSSFFGFFGFELESGDPRRVLSAPFTIVITRDLAGKYFGDRNPVGEVIRINNMHDYTVTGVAANPPSNSHISFQAVSSFISLYEIHSPASMDQWLSISYFTYIRFNRNFKSEIFFEKLEDLFEDRFGENAREIGLAIDPFLQPVTSIHLNSDMIVELSPPGSRARVYIFLAVSVFILVLACINFMNLSTARASLRSREVGVRKVTGASRGELIRQFLGESIVYSLIAGLLAIPLIELALPAFNSITNLQLSFFSVTNLRILMIFLPFILFVGILAGSYPAFVLSSFNPLRTIRGDNIISSGRSWLRSGLIVFQMIISITLVVCTIFVWKQLEYINSRDLGFEKHNKVIINLVTRELRNRHEVIGQELLAVPGINDIAVSTSYPGTVYSATVYKPEGAREEIILSHVFVDHRYAALMGIRVIEGRDFDRAFSSDSLAVLVNETAVRTFGWTDPVGMTISRGHAETGAETFRVIGVAGDFHFKSIHQSVEPLVIHLLRGLPRYMTIDVSPVNFPQSIAGLKSAWEKINPDEPFEFRMLSDEYDFHYRSEIQLSRIFTSFTILAFIIAALGMYGLSSFMVENRTKEIGVRKVFGAPVTGIVLSFLRQFGIWLLIANVISWAIAWFYMNNWLNLFAYKISVNNPLVFIISALISVFVIILAAGYQSLKAAYINPARSLRYE